MSRLGRLARAALSRVAPPLDPELKAALSAVHRAATRVAESPLGDEEARRELEAAVAPHPEGVELVLALWRGLRYDYVQDRAFRLLSAVAAAGPVEPMPPESAELFERERELGQLPLGEAFARLKALYPTLAEIEQDVVSGSLAVNSERGISVFDVPLGRAVGHADPLLRSDLALNVAIAYLDSLAGVPGSMALEAPLFSAARRKGVSTGVFGRPEPPP
jgi:hypothetical protein